MKINKSSNSKILTTQFECSSLKKQRYLCNSKINKLIFPQRWDVENNLKEK